MKIHVENTYSDGHESERDTEVREPAPGEDIEEFWEEVLWEETGDGHGISRDVESYYAVTILESASPELVGQKREWC
jgi:hypothetical protein